MGFDMDQYRPRPAPAQELEGLPEIDRLMPDQVTKLLRMDTDGARTLRKNYGREALEEAASKGWGLRIYGTEILEHTRRAEG